MIGEAGPLFDGVPAEARVRSAERDEAPGASPASAIAVHTLTRFAKDIVEGGMPPLWVRGEVTDFKGHYASGHWYFGLRDANAKMWCVMWKPDVARVRTRPEDGLLVTAFGQMSVYPKTGEMQFVVKKLGAEGDGLWRKQLRETYERLKADGLVDPARKRPVPLLPRCVAVVTSAEGAVWHDIQVVAAARHRGVPLVLAPARVQGEGAEASLVAALERVARWGGADVCIIGRGGGARDDLWAFNDERVARAVAAMPIPVISAVGHETDTSIVDLVADVRAATPSQAAETAVPDLAALTAQRDALAQRLRLAALRTVRARRERIRVVGGRFASAAGRLRATEATRLQRFEHRMTTALTGRLAREEARVAAVRPALEARMAARLAAGRSALAGTAAALHALSPLATLERGFVVTRDTESGRALPSVADVVPGQRIDLLFRDGAVRARTEHVRAGDPLQAVTAFPDG